MPWCQVHLRTCKASIRTETDGHMHGRTHAHMQHTHTRSNTQGHMSAFMGTGRWSSHIFCEISGLDCLSLCSFSHAMARHGAPWHAMCLCLLCPSLPSVGQLDPSWMPIYIYITFQVAVQVLAALGQKIRK
jgi:hypothetical protein